jgi:TPR repeat protein
MRQRIICLQLLFFLLTTVPAWGQTTVIKRQSETQRPRQISKTVAKPKVVEMTKEQYFERAKQQSNAAAALPDYRKAADMGHAEALDSIGMYYYDGKGGVDKDYLEAVIYFKKSAELGNASGMFHRGQMYNRGEGVTKDRDEALKWFRKAAELGNLKAMGNIGNSYRDGDGVAKSYSEALKWYRKAADKSQICK